ncbi:MAG: murein biosynthesis integral membrane protein MurJ [Candidatus Geothermincolia bacterium]
MLQPEDQAQAVDVRAFARNASVMAAGTITSRITGFLRYAALAYALGLTLQFGGTNLPSTYNLANSLPNMIFDLVLGGILASLFIPVFVEHLTSHGEREAWYVASSVTNLSLLILGGVAVAGIFASPIIIRLMTAFGSYQGDGATTAAVRDQAAFLLRFFLPQIIFYGLSAVFTGLLNSHKHFKVPAFAPALNNVVVVITVIIFRSLPGGAQSRSHLAVLGIGTTLGVVLQALVQIPPLLRLGVRYSPVLGLRHPAVRKIGRLAVPLLGYITLWQISTWFVFVLAIQRDGGVPSYQYAQMFFQLPYGVIAVSVITALFPTLSQQAAARTMGEYKKTLSLGLRATFLVIAPACIAYLLLNQGIIRLLLEHGLFKSGDTVVLAQVLFFFALGLIPYSLDMLLTKGFYAMQDTKTPMIINCFVVAVNMGANYIFFRLLGIRGLALGFSTAYLFSMCVDWVVLRRRIGPMGGRRIFTSFGKLTVAAGMMALVVLGLDLGLRNLGARGLAIDLARVFGPLIAGTATYLLAASALQVRELSLLRGLFAAMLRRRRQAGA